MRLPQHLVESPFFQFPEVDSLLAALSDKVGQPEREAIRQLGAQGLPPITSIEALSVMIGINRGLIWSFINRPVIHYRCFKTPKGKTERTIYAPRVALKIIQKWISVHIGKAYQAPSHVFGFVQGRSHIDAAMQHIGAEWCYSVDIADFFPSTPVRVVQSAYQSLGYSPLSSKLLSSLSCIGGALAQGAPTSPALSNICFGSVDAILEGIASRYGAKLTRYADDIVVSGRGVFPAGLKDDLKRAFEGQPWTLREDKNRLQPLKGRIKVHGLLIKGDVVKLTKGYRNKVRAYSHVLSRNPTETKNVDVLRGHIRYAVSVSTRTGTASGIGHSGLDWQKPDSKITGHNAHPSDTDVVPNNIWNRVREKVRKALGRA